MPFDVTLADGKYRFVQDEKYKLTVYRYGEPWNAYNRSGPGGQPDNLHIALGQELFDCRAELAQQKIYEAKAANFISQVRDLAADADPHDSVSALNLVEQLQALVSSELKAPEPQSASANTIYMQAYDGEGKLAHQGMYGSNDVRKDVLIMGAIRDYEDAHRRGVDVAGVKVGSFRLVPAADEELHCDFCQAVVSDPWHGSGELNGQLSKHIHACDACKHKLPNSAAEIGPESEEILRDTLGSIFTHGHARNSERGREAIDRAMNMLRDRQFPDRQWVRQALNELFAYGQNGMHDKLDSAIDNVLAKLGYRP